jgi:hypothetical protein
MMFLRMKIQCKFIFDYPSIQLAQVVYRSLQIDNQDYLKSWLRESQIEVIITGSSIPPILHTLNDFLSCLTVAEQVTIMP